MYVYIYIHDDPSPLKQKNTSHIWRLRHASQSYFLYTSILSRVYLRITSRGEKVWYLWVSKQHPVETQSKGCGRRGLILDHAWWGYASDVNV